MCFRGVFPPVISPICILLFRSRAVLDALTLAGKSALLIGIMAEMVTQTGRNVPISICQQLNTELQAQTTKSTLLH